MTSTTPSTTEPAPIIVLIRYIFISLSHIVKATSSFFHSASWLIRSTFFYPSALFLSPLTVLLSISLYIFAPAIVFVQVVLDVFVFTPYNLVVYLVDAIYPVYVFCGVACITGIVVGMLARQLVLWLIELGSLDEMKEPSTGQPTELVAPKPEWAEA